MKLIGAMCRCAECGEVFAEPIAFAFHRQGPMEARKCESPSALNLVWSEKTGWNRPVFLARRMRLTAARKGAARGVPGRGRAA